MSGITIFCFGASYAVALLLEIVGLWYRFGWHRVVMIGMALAGLFAHTTYLVLQATGDTLAVGSPSQWYLIVGWVLACLYIANLFATPRAATGLFLLPLIEILVVIAAFSSREPFADGQGPRMWGQLHGVLLALGAVAVSVGFLAGLMYLVQSWRLKNKLPPTAGFRLPSLEVLERINGASLGLSTILVAGGVLAGVMLSRSAHVAEPWSSLARDPLVLTSSVMLLWLVVAEIFRRVYPPARHGQKVAYLTLASFVFLVITLGAMRWGYGVHSSPSGSATASATASERGPS